MDKARAGDKVVFNGCIIAVPDVSVISAPGERVTSVARNAGAGGAAQGGGENTIRGLKATGVRELSYKLCFLGSSVQVRRRPAVQYAP